jgi:predicted GH43/DUF377 family glycosyl hydrolase
MKTNSHFSLILMGLILSVFLPASSCAQLNWEKYEDNPIIEGNYGQWDEWIWIPVVIYEDGLFKMWYCGWYYQWPDDTRQIGYAESTDGITWNFNDDPVIPSGPQYAWDYHRYPGTVLRINDTVRMWYSGSTNSSDDFSIGYAWAVDENSWNVLPNPVFEKGGGGYWDDFGVLFPSVHYDGEIYHMLYTGISGAHLQIGYATSVNGINWVKDVYINPVIPYGDDGTFYDVWVLSSGLVVYNDTIRMFFNGFDGDTFYPEPTYFRVGYAWSTDYINWTVENNMEPVVHVGEPGSWDDRWVRSPTVLIHDGRLKMWYSGFQFDVYGKIGYAEDSTLITGLPDIYNVMPVVLSVTPNPFKDDVTITYQLQEKSTVQLDVYNYSGQLISSLLNDAREQGNHEIYFEGAEIQPGIYFCVLKTNEVIQTKKMIKL